MFGPYSNSLEVIGRDDDKIKFKIRGFQTYSSGEYTNERNREIEFEVELDKAREIINDLNKLLGDS